MKMLRKRAKRLNLLLLFILGTYLLSGGNTAFAAGEITLYTPYTSISVPPGKSSIIPLKSKTIRAASLRSRSKSTACRAAGAPSLTAEAGG